MENKDINILKNMTTEEIKDYMTAEKKKLAYQFFLRSNGIRENMLLGANCLNISLKTFLTYVRDYIKNNMQSEISKVFDILEQLNTDYEIITYLDSVNLPLNYLESNLLNYITNFRPDVLFKENKLLSNLRKKLSIYEKFLESKNIDKNNNEELSDESIKVITDFIHSNYSLERFCFMRQMDKNTFKQYVNKIKQINPYLYNEYLKNYESKENYKNIEIESNVINILSLIKKLEIDFMAYHLFSNTRYGIKELIKCADSILTLSDAKLFRMYVKYYLNTRILREIAIKNIFNEIFIFNVDGELIEITSEIKTEVINFLKENNTPISIEIFKETCIKICRENKKHR